jgi:hypothetical protein
MVIKELSEGWGYSSVIEYLPSMCEMLGLIPRPQKKSKIYLMFLISIAKCMCVLNK